MFEGFSPETVDFLWGIRMNNNREWFMEHKSDYVNHLYEPMKALGKEVFQPFVERSGNLLKVSRIYRDARMHHPLPYKESLWICIRQDVEWWAENPCVYFEITPDGMSYGFFWWKPRVQVLKDFRQRIAAKPDEFLKLIADTEAAVGMPIQAELYKRPPQKTEDPRLERFFAWKGQIGCSVDLDFNEDTFYPKLAEEVTAFFEKMLPLYEYCNYFKV